MDMTAVGTITFHKDGITLDGEAQDWFSQCKPPCITFVEDGPDSGYYVVTNGYTEQDVAEAAGQAQPPVGTVKAR